MLRRIFHLIMAYIKWVIIFVFIVYNFGFVENYKVHVSSESEQLNKSPIDFSHYDLEEYQRRDRSTNVKSITTGHVYSFQNVRNDDLVRLYVLFLLCSLICNCIIIL